MSWFHRSSCCRRPRDSGLRIGGDDLARRSGRKHNRLSVKPVLTLYREESDGKIYVKNNGTGPALIRDYEIYKDDKLIAEQEIRTALPLLLRSASLTNGVALAPGDTIDLIESRTYADLTHIPPLEALRFRIRYASIYDETWVLE